ncbi:MAG TPA: YihY/virulence factor BrkB family protein [Dehalococcoidales bacterium]|nr:YihY/virulence factor BrkB family protein [Dehalococcoidales bacterium]
MENISSFRLFFKRFQIRVVRLYHDLMETVWVRFSLTLARKVSQHDVSIMAAGIAYYAFLSLFPLVLALLFIMSLILPPESVIEQLGTFFSRFLPGSPEMLENAIPELSVASTALGAVGIIGLFWAATGVFSATTRGINRAWEIRFNHPLYIKKPKELLMVLGTGILFLLSFGVSTFLVMLSQLAFPFSGSLVNAGTIVVAFIFTVIVFLLLNKMLPVTGISWRHVWPGALLSSVLFEVAKTFFVLYINTTHTYDRIYGSIASIVVLLVWIYYSAYIVLLGAEFNSLLFKLKRDGQTFDKPEEKPQFVRDP